MLNGIDRSAVVCGALAAGVAGYAMQTWGTAKAVKGLVKGVLVNGMLYSSVKYLQGRVTNLADLKGLVSGQVLKASALGWAMGAAGVAVVKLVGYGSKTVKQQSASSQSLTANSKQNQVVDKVKAFSALSVDDLISVLTSSRLDCWNKEIIQLSLFAQMELPRVSHARVANPKSATRYNKTQELKDNEVLPRSHPWAACGNNKVERVPVPADSTWDNVPKDYKPPLSYSAITQACEITNAPQVPKEYSPENSMSDLSEEAKNAVEVCLEQFKTSAPNEYEKHQAVFDNKGVTQKKFFQTCAKAFFADPNDPNVIGTEADPRFGEMLQGGKTKNPYYLASARPMRERGLVLNQEGLPLHPIGPTGMAGRVAGKWGANCAADIMMTRVSENGMIQFIGGKRGELKGIPCLVGGMVDPLDKDTYNTVKRELAEEALGRGFIKSKEAALAKKKSNAKEDDETIEALEKELEEATAIYKANKALRDSICDKNDNYVLTYSGRSGDQRDTDHAWYVTDAYVVVLTEEEGQQLYPIAGDDLKEAAWTSALAFAQKETFAAHNEIMVVSMLNRDVQLKLLANYPQHARELCKQFGTFGVIAKAMGITEAGA